MTIELTGITWDHPRAFEPLVAASDAYGRSHPGVTITWEKRSLQVFADHPIADLAAHYDLMVIDHPHVGSAAGEGCLVAFDGRGYDNQLAVLARESIGRSHESYALAGRQWALALDAASQVSAFRPDLIDDDEIPRTWDAVVELAKTGWVLWPIKPVDSVMSFFSLAANRGTPCGEGDQLISSDDGLAVLDAMSQLCRHVPKFCLDGNPIEVLDLMAAEDRYAYCPLAFGYSNYARAGFRRRLVKFTNIPALGDDGPRGAILGGTGMAVSSRCQAIDAAVDFAFWVCAAECQKGVYFTSGGQSANATAWDDPLVNAACNDFFRSTRETLDRSYLRPRFDGFLDFQQAGGDIIHEFLRGQTSAASAIVQLNGAYQSIVA